MKKVLNVGAGLADNPTEVNGETDLLFTRLDIDPERNPDIIHDITTPLPHVLEGKYDYVYASHVFEHISWRTALATMKNVSQALKPGGMFVILVPDIEYAARRIMAGNYGMGEIGILYGGQHSPWEYHNCGFTTASMRTALKNIGFEPVYMKTEPVGVVINGSTHVGYQITTIAKRLPEKA